MIVTKKHITIRLAQPQEAACILEVREEAIYHLAKDDYEQDILEAWAKPINAARIQAFAHDTSGIKLVALLDHTITGYGELVPSRNLIGGCYIGAAYARRGIGSALLQALERLAQEHQLNHLKLASSLTAEPFYQKHGYQSLEYAERIMPNGKPMAFVKMRKEIKYPSD